MLQLHLFHRQLRNSQHGCRERRRVSGGGCSPQSAGLEEAGTGFGAPSLVSGQCVTGGTRLFPTKSLSSWAYVLLVQ